MADKESKFPMATAMQFPDGAQFLYLQAAEDLAMGTFVEPNTFNRMIKFRGEIKFPRGICVEPCPKDYFTFILIKEPMAPSKKAEVPAVEM